MKSVEDFLRLFVPAAAGTVVVVVGAHASYAEALGPSTRCKVLDEDETLAEGAARATGQGVPAADVVVLACPAARRRTAVLAACRHLLEPGGLLIVPSCNPRGRAEAAFSAYPGPRWRPWAARRAVRRAGFGKTALYVAVSSAGGSTVLLSADRTATAFYFLRQDAAREGWAGRLVGWVRSVAARSGLLWRREPEFIVCARK